MPTLGSAVVACAKALVAKNVLTAIVTRTRGKNCRFTRRSFRCPPNVSAEHARRYLRDLESPRFGGEPADPVYARLELLWAQTAQVTMAAHSIVEALEATYDSNLTSVVW